MHTFAKNGSRTPALINSATPKAGNSQIRNILRGGVQPKLKIGAVNDPAEVEADRVAEQLMRMPTSRMTDAPLAPPPDDNGNNGQGRSGLTIHRKCAACDDEKVQRKPAVQTPPVIRRHTAESGSSNSTASPQASSAINSLGSGLPLPSSERSFFEPRFGRDLSGVRVHNGSTADAASRAINARAFSLGNNIAFASGEYQPGTQSGRTLIAHEITHTLQGGGGVNQLVKRKETRRDPDTANNGLTIYRIQSGDTFWGLGEKSEEKFGRKITSDELQAYNPELTKKGLEIGDWLALIPQDRKNLEYLEPGWMDVGKPGIVYKEKGAYFSDYPTGPRTLLAQNTKVSIIKAKPDPNGGQGWYAVHVHQGGSNKVQYVADTHIWFTPQNMDVDIYKATNGDTAVGIVKKHYKNEFKDWGDDNRMAVNSLVYVNMGVTHNAGQQSGIFKKKGRSDDWDEAQVTANKYIWIPTADYLKSIRAEVLKDGGGSGSISFDAVSKAIDFVYTGVARFLGFQGGLIHGFFKSFYDLIADAVKGIYDFVKSVFDGTLLSKLKTLWDSLISGEMWKGLKAYVKQKFDEFYANLTGDNPWKSGHAAGYVVGYLTAEAVMMFFTGGATAAAKAAFTATKFGAKILEIVGKTGKIVKATQIGSKTVQVIKLAGTAFKAVQKARSWALNALMIPAKYVLDLTLKNVNRLRGLPNDILNKFRNLKPHQKKYALGCNSPCDCDPAHVTNSVNLFNKKTHSRIPEQNDAIRKALLKTNAKPTRFSKEGSPIFQRLKPDGSLKSEWYYLGPDGKQIKIAKKTFNPPNVSSAIKPPKGGWYKYLEGLIGSPPFNMKSPHAHHILFKRGIGEAQQKLVKEGQDILRRNTIDPLYGKEVLAWAPNIKGQHVIGNLDPLVKALKGVDKMNMAPHIKRATIVGILKKHGDLAAKVGN